MNKVYAGIASVGFLVLGSQAGCSSADPPTGTGGTTATGATGSVGGTNVIPMGGTGTGTAGTAATTAGTGVGGAGTAGTGAGTAGTGTAGTPGVADPACKGIKTAAVCAPEGTACPGLACGLADSGSRSCNCAATWMCQPCDYTASPFKDKPAQVLPCSGIEADKVACTEADKGKVCSSAGGEVCACWTDDEGGLIWDCDKPPSTWGAL
ncbi:MAG: hypothetical protein K0R38_1966 [Polyangiaceae bacterium]|jgi:hypothetical protein|nr:hypothetical protein [Polyangiaceae bacterium]